MPAHVHPARSRVALWRIARLEVSAFDLTEGTMTFYRPKVQKEQTHKLTRDALAAVRAYSSSTRL